MLELKNFFVTTDGKEILKKINLKIKPGESHCLMGPNGSGKSSLSLALLSHPRYRVTGQLFLDGKDITSLSPDKKAKLGLFLSMQNPIGIPGVSVLNLLRQSQKNLVGKVSPPAQFLQTVKTELKALNLDEGFLKRSIHDSFSGGEKKKAEILQLNILKPKYILLDETDSGLDVDALKKVATGIKTSLGKDTGLLLITHYTRILKYLKPDFVHILKEGRIIKSGDYKLAEEIEEKGYSHFETKS
jgi:Fe-S cluster assembly ATP-binding protein